MSTATLHRPTAAPLVLELARDSAVEAGDPAEAAATLEALAAHYDPERQVCDVEDVDYPGRDRDLRAVHAIHTTTCWFVAGFIVDDWSW